MFLQIERWVEREHSFLGRQLFFSFWSKNTRCMLHLFYWLRCQQGCISNCGVIAACLWKEDRNGDKLLSWIKRGGELAAEMWKFCGPSTSFTHSDVDAERRLVPHQVLPLIAANSHTCMRECFTCAVAIHLSKLQRWPKGTYCIITVGPPFLWL